MEAATAKLWETQDRLVGDRGPLFAAAADVVGAGRVLYPGSYVDIAPSFVWQDVTYLDTDRRANRFFTDAEGVAEIIAQRTGAPPDPTVTFVHADYTAPELFAPETFDVMISLYAGPISRHCTDYLRVGGSLLVNSSHGDVGFASLDERYELAAVMQSRAGAYTACRDDLGSHLVTKKPVEVTVELLERTGRGVAYTKSPFAYVFVRVR